MDSLLPSGIRDECNNVVLSNPLATDCQKSADPHRPSALNVREGATKRASRWDSATSLGSRQVKKPRPFYKSFDQELSRHRENLPIFHFKEEFVNAVKNNQVLVVVGETGSGKSTQMPQYLLEAGVVCGRIGVTQPRKVAAIAVAKRVAKEYGCSLGFQVGYSVRFENASSRYTLIKYLTDGILLKECLHDSDFSSYECIILDEAHERSLYTDVLMGLLKRVLQKRPDFKVIVTSATIEDQKFADYFNNAPVVKIPGKMYPVETRYLPLLRGGMSMFMSSMHKSEQYVQNAVNAVMQIHLDPNLSPEGDLLLFLPGKEEVETACSSILSLDKQKTLIPKAIYAALPFGSQSEIFESAKTGCRKVIVATNIAETSITIDGISHVVDSGFFKEKAFDGGIDSLKVRLISKAQANQRKGRAGRTGPGVCYRLYSEEDFNRMLPVPVPSIHRDDLTLTTLQLKFIGIDDIPGFGFIDPPKVESVNFSLSRLQEIGALSELDLKITSLGRKMAEFPLSPHLSKMLILSSEMNCSEELLIIVSLLSAGNIFIWPWGSGSRAEAEQKKSNFHDPKGDHLTLLNAFHQWIDNGQCEVWAKENFLNQKMLETACSIREQLQKLMVLVGVPLVSVSENSRSNICRALLSGSTHNVARKDPYSRSPHAYKTLTLDQTVFLHPSSCLREIKPKYVIFHESIDTYKNFILTVSECEEEWLVGLPNYKP